MKRLIAILVLLALSGASESLLAKENDNTKTTGDDATDREMVKLQKKSRSLKTCTATVTTTIRVEDQEVTVTGSGIFMGPGKMRVEESLPDGGGQVVLSDGSYLWMHDRSENMVSRINLARVYQVTKMEADVHQFDPLRPFRGVDWSSIRYTGKDSVDGAVYEGFAASTLPSLLSAQLPSPPVRVKLSVHPADGLLRMARLYDADENEVVVQTFSDLQGNREVDSKLFEFVAPAGAHPMDATDELIGFFKSVE